MLEKALKQSEPSKYFNGLLGVVNPIYNPLLDGAYNTDAPYKICKCGVLLLTEEQEFNHKPICKEK
jgi:hypothetical protein